MALITGVVLSVAIQAHGQEPPQHIEYVSDGVSIWTDAVNYDRGSVIVVHGHSTQGPVTILVLNPNGNLADVHQFDTDGPFSLELDTSGPYWKLDGWYRLTAKAGPGSEYVSLVFGVGTGCAPGSIPVDAGDEGIHCMVSDGASSAVLDVDSKTMTLNIQEGGATLQIPRHLLDSRIGDEDSAFVTIQEDQPVPHIEISADQDFRTIVIETKGSIAILGTHAIPEFGAVILVAAAAGGAAAYVSRYGRIKLPES